MPDLILSLPHYHRHIAICICVVQIIDTPHNFRPCVSFARFAFYIAVLFDKHLYLTSCLNAHNHNTCIRLPQTSCIARKMALFIISQDRQTQIQAGDAMTTTITVD